MVQRVVFYLKAIKFVIHLFYMVVVFFGFIVLGIWFLDRELPRIVLSGTVSPQHVKPGEVLHVQWVVKGIRHCPGIAIRSLEDECGSHLLYDGPIANPDLPIDKESIIALNIVIPKTATPGRCEFRSILEQYCNPLHRVFPLVLTLKPLVFYVDRVDDKEYGH